MKAKLRKELRAAAPLPRRRGSRPAFPNLAASSVTRLAAFKSGARVAVYLPFDRETNTAALLVAARRRRDAHLRSRGRATCAIGACASTL